MINQAIALKAHINTIINLADIINAARDAIGKRTGIGDTIIFGSPESIKYMDEFRIDPVYKLSNKALIDFVNNHLDDDQTHLIRTIMYIGRDYLDSNKLPDILLKDQFNSMIVDSKDIAIQHMIGKKPLPDYLRKGMTKLSI